MDAYRLATGTYHFVTAGGDGTLARIKLAPAGEIRNVSYGELAAIAGADRREIAILRTSGSFSLTGALPPEPDLDRALATGENEYHVWSGPPTDRAPEGADAAMVAAAMRHFVSRGGTCEALRAMVDALEA